MPIQTQQTQQTTCITRRPDKDNNNTINTNHNAPISLLPVQPVLFRHLVQLWRLQCRADAGRRWRLVGRVKAGGWLGCLLTMSTPQSSSAGRTVQRAEGRRREEQGTQRTSLTLLRSTSCSRAWLYRCGGRCGGTVAAWLAPNSGHSPFDDGETTSQSLPQTHKSPQEQDRRKTPWIGAPTQHLYWKERKRSGWKEGAEHVRA